MHGSITRFRFSHRTAQLYAVRCGEQPRSDSLKASHFALRAFCEDGNPSRCQGLVGSMYSPSLAEATVYGYTFLLATPRRETPKNRTLAPEERCSPYDTNGYTIRSRSRSVSSVSLAACTPWRGRKCKTAG